MNFNFYKCLEDLSNEQGQNIFIKGIVYKLADDIADNGDYFLFDDLGNRTLISRDAKECFKKLNKEDSVCKAALYKYGSREQIGMLMEECMELAFACRKHLRNPNPERQNNIIEEIADVEIMIKQFKMISSEFPEEIKKQRKSKINRLKKRLCKPSKKE